MIPLDSIHLYNKSELLSSETQSKFLFSPGSLISLKIEFPEKIFSSLIEAIKQDDNDTFLSLILEAYRCGWGIDQLQDIRGWALIHYACYYGSVLITKNLTISYEKSLNFVTSEGWTPLMLATYHKNFTIVKSICACKLGNINTVTLKGTALHQAVEAQDIKIVTFLLQMGAKIQLEDGQGRTCIEIPTSPEILEIIPIISGESIVSNSFNFHFTQQEWLVKRVKPKFSKDYSCVLTASIADGRFQEISSITCDNSRPIAAFKKKLIKLEVIQNCFSPDSTKFYFKLYFPGISLKYWVISEDERNDIVSKIKKISDYCRCKDIGIRPCLKEKTLSIQKAKSEEDNCVQQTISLKEFEHLNIVGSGSFGTVYQIRHKCTNEVFALKSCDRLDIDQKSKIKYAIIECEILRSINNPFIVRLFWAIATKKHLNLILEFCPGGDLGRVLDWRGPLSDWESRFILASIVLGLQALHAKDIVCRDLKPANILIDSSGYLKLCDFGLAQNNVKGDKMNAKLVGSPSYLAPEGILNEKVGKKADIWALGVIAYLLYTGYLPFTGQDLIMLYNNILKKEILYQSTLSSSAKCFIKSLLQRDPVKRLNIEQVMSHEYFKSIDWDTYAKKKYEPPAFLLEQLRCS